MTFDLTVGSSGRYALEVAEMLVSLVKYKSLESLNSIGPSTTDIPTYHIMTLGNWNGLGWLVWSSGWGDFVVQLVEVSSGRSWCLSGWDGHGC